MAFEVIISSNEEHQVITLKNKITNASAEIYTYGALLNKFCACYNNEELNVIDGFVSPHEAAEKLTPYFKSAKLSPYACRIKDAKYTVGETGYTLAKYSSDGNALHGLLFDAVFKITAQNSDEHSAVSNLEYIYDNKNEGYPFRYKCEVEYKLTADNTLSISTTVTNMSNELMPVVDGWHPYFTLGGSINSYQLEFQSREMLEFDENLIPTGKLVPYKKFETLTDLGDVTFDNCFTINFAENRPACVIRNPERKVQIEFHPAATYPYLQIYTPKHRKSIAIENLSAAPDAFNNGMGLEVLKPNESTNFTTEFIIRFL